MEIKPYFVLCILLQDMVEEDLLIGRILQMNVALPLCLSITP